ncbi:unnamed protein product [Coffea canephora]|uniref:Branchpoint-bridging protein n=1 Tax=Coffea canephora TaxID=49390 RepID=A0A068U9K6_COFCA|nr:unnamed protein product [Coffea canephora]
MASFPPSPELDVQPIHGLTTELSLGKDNIVGEEPEWDTKDEFCNRTETKSLGQSFVPLVSCHDKDVTELIEDQSENASQQHRLKSFSNLYGDDHGCLNQKKRALNVEALKPSDQLQQKFRSQGDIKCESDFTDAIRDSEIGNGALKSPPNSSESNLLEERAGSSRTGALKSTRNGSESNLLEERAGSSGKWRRTRLASEQSCEIGESDGTNKRRKTRWDVGDAQIKLLGPMHLSEFYNQFKESELDPEINDLKMQLVEINSKLQSSDVQDDRPEEERSPSPEPMYNNLGIRINTREVRLRRRLSDERTLIISKLVEKNPTFKTPLKPKLTKLFKKLYVPVKEYPTYNFIGLIIGPRGNTQKKMEKETGAKIYLRGKGALKALEKRGQAGNEDLHVRVEADNKRSLDAAVAMIEKLLIPFADGVNVHKRAQLAELARLEGTYKDKNTCNTCKEQGHREYACPFRKSTFRGITCDSCGSFCHPTSNCPMSSQLYKPSWNSFGLGSVLVPNRESNLHKETDFTNLYVGHLPQIFGSNKLKELFLPFGKISDAKVIKNRITGLNKGYGFIAFENSSDAARAVEYMNGYEFNGKKLAVRLAEQ